MTKRTETWSYIGPLALLVTAFAASLAGRVAFVDDQAERRRVRVKPDDVLVSPGPNLLRAAALEHPAAWADVLWLGIVQELGRHIEGAVPSWDRLLRWTNIATDLDPRYYVVYYAGAIHLSVYAGHPEGSDQILHKGMQALPDRWEFPFLLGYNAYFIHGDADLAADYWRTAAADPEAPRFLPSLAARAQFQAGDERGAIEVLETFKDILSGPQREDAEIRLKLFESEFRLRLYDEACRAHREAFGEIPTAVWLFEQGRVTEPPEDLLGGRIELDGACRARTEQVFVREDEALERIGFAGARMRQMEEVRRSLMGSGGEKLEGGTPGERPIQNHGEVDAP